MAKTFVEMAKTCVEMTQCSLLGPCSIECNTVSQDNV